MCKLMGARNEVTIYDIANALKLSPSTISRALSGDSGVHTQTREKVAKVASDLGYRRNSFGSRQKTKKKPMIAAVVTQLNTPIASSVLTGAEITASQWRYNLIVRQSMNKPELRAANIERLKNDNVDGLLVTSSYFQEYASVGELAKLKKPLMVIETSSMLPGRPKKKGGDFENAYELTEYLIKKECRHIAYLSVDTDQERHRRFVAGYSNALQNSKLHEANVLVSNDFENGWIDMCRMLVSMTPRPDGILMSMQRITVLAFSESDSSRGNGDEFWITCRKGVSTQNQLLVELGKVAAGLVISLIESKQPAVPADIRGMSHKAA